MTIRSLFYFFKRCVNFFYYNKIFVYVLLFIFLNSLTFHFLGLSAVVVSFFYSLKVLIIRHYALKIKEKNNG